MVMVVQMMLMNIQKIQIVVLIFIILWSSVTYETTIRFNNKFTAYIEWMGKNVTRAYVFQWLIIGNIATSVYKTQNELQLRLWFIGIVVMVSITVYGWGLVKDTLKTSVKRN
jgi:hypothetical protein